MRCDEFEQRVHQLLDERQPVHADRSVAEHAGACPRCQSLLDAYQDLWDGLDLLDPPPLDAEFATRVVVAVPLARPPRQVPRWLPWAAMAIAASLLVLATAAWWQRHFETAPPPDSVPTSSQPGLAVHRLGPDGGASREDKLAPSAPVTESIRTQPLEAIFQHLAGQLSAEHIGAVDGLAMGLRPIRESLTTAFDVLRTAIPLRLDGQADPGSRDSASSFRPTAGSSAV